MDTEPGQPRTAGKTLLLLRHAKSSWLDDVEDHDRSLAGRGRRDAVAVGQLLADRGLAADLVLCSTAARTRQTWELAVEGGARASEIRYLDGIYAASAAALARIVRALPETAVTVVMVGHSPGIPDLVSLLAVRRTGSAAWQRLDRKFPTSGLATLEIPGSWADAGRTRAELALFDVPRGPANDR